MHAFLQLIGLFILVQYATAQVNPDNALLTTYPALQLAEAPSGELVWNTQNSIEYYNGNAIFKNDTTFTSLFQLETAFNASLIQAMHNQAFSNPKSWKIAGSSSKLKYILSDQNQLYIYLKKGIKKFTIPFLENDLHINSIRFQRPYLLISTMNNGLLIWDEEDYNIKKFDIFSGLSSNMVQDAIIDQWGNLWIANDLKIRLVKQFINTTLQTPILSNIIIQKGKNILDTSQQIMLEESDDLLINYKSIQLTNAKSIRTEYRLHDNAEWIICTDGYLLLHNLNIGEYKLQLRTTTDSKYYDFSPKYGIKIKEKLFSNTVAYLLFGFMFFIAIWLLSLIYQYRKNKQYTLERDKYKLENQLLISEKRALQMQMNPHFMFNALNAIQGLITLDEKEKAQSYLNDFSNMLRSMLNQSRTDTITLSDEVEYLNKYLRMEQLANNDKFDYKINVSEELEDDILIPNMIIQPFIENAIKHAFKNRKSGTIIIDIRALGRHVSCTIEDDGIGRQKPINAKAKSHHSLGVQVVNERLARYHRNDNREFVIYTDLAENSVAKGTKVEIIIPILG